MDTQINTPAVGIACKATLYTLLFLCLPMHLQFGITSGQICTSGVLLLWEINAHDGLAIDSLLWLWAWYRNRTEVPASGMEHIQFRNTETDTYG